ncbi:MAG TPA: selenocysteine-specific translation elongation factor [Burkholderiaceae bacterium]|nr:selenocysteine-specific translation elongation factor [Burkholderiaceae bacterium]
MLIGTAGHIDHGKTSLIKRLTGRNTDRLPEEQRRGISIELGYAYVQLAGSQDVVGFVDVPGHERFVHTMVAGATGIDFALLVVAADDGVMLQTEEHLDILRLLGVTRGAVALTKIDAVEAVRSDAVCAQLAAHVRGTPAAAWPVFPVSALTDAGIDALAAHLHEQARAFAAAARERGGHFRLAVDRVFTLPGVGTVVTGTVHAGVVRVADEVVVVPGRGVAARVRTIHAQDRPAAQGVAGQRCALNLAGIDKTAVERGQWVQGAQLANVTERVDAALQLLGEARGAARLSIGHGPQASRLSLAPGGPSPAAEAGYVPAACRDGSAQGDKALRNWATVFVHHGTAAAMARVAVLDGERIDAGGAQLVSLALDRPLAVCRGDRFVIRDASARRTLGGGIVLDNAPPARGKRTPVRLGVLQAVRDEAPADALARWLEAQPLARGRLESCWNLSAGESARLLAAVDARVAAGTAFAASTWERLRERALAVVAASHEREPEMPGIEQNRLRRMVAPALSVDAFSELADELLSNGRLARRGAFLGDPQHKAELGRDERVRWERIQPLLMEQPFDPPRVRDVAHATGIAEGEVRLLLKRVARIGTIALVAHDHFFMTDAVRRMADIAAELEQADGAARAAPFRDRIGTGRKVAIQILEFFDRVGYTRRIRDDHRVRRANPWHESGQQHV